MSLSVFHANSGSGLRMRRLSPGTFCGGVYQFVPTIDQLRFFPQAISADCPSDILMTRLRLTRQEDNSAIGSSRRGDFVGSRTGVDQLDRSFHGPFLSWDPATHDLAAVQEPGTEFRSRAPVQSFIQFNLIVWVSFRTCFSRTGNPTMSEVRANNGEPREKWSANSLELAR
ncbi:hypothetical protein BDW72DRAFT_6116 [Aspergillus terricola var. indicus]